eukprot:scaffold67823_cov48-Prasinocladus_malaysianus.AAC.1
MNCDAVAAPTTPATTRARRLSYVTANQASEAEKIADVLESPPANQETVPAVNNPVRARRLSDISSAQGKQAILAGTEAPVANPEVQRPLKFNPEKLRTDSLQERPVDVEVVCISRAGQDPGLQKTNQDNCFAYDFYLRGDQCLFSALDGHGPNGHMVSGFVKQNLPELLVHHLQNDEEDVPAALTEGFLEVDQKLSDSHVDCEFSGSTAV